MKARLLRMMAEATKLVEMMDENPIGDEADGIQIECDDMTVMTVEFDGKRIIISEGKS